MKKFRFLFILAGLAVITALIFFSCLKCQEAQITKLKADLASLEEERIPLRFLVEHPAKNRIEVSIRYMDSAGQSGPEKTYQLEGNQLYFDFIVIPYKKSFLAFPWKIFTDKIKPDDGILICKDYDHAGYPMIFEQSNTTEKDDRKIEEFYAKIKNGDWDQIKNTYGNAVHDIKDISSFKTSVIYKIVARKLGGIEIMEE